MARLVSAAFLLAATLSAPPAAAGTDDADADDAVPRPVVAVAAGAALSFASVGFGAVTVARADDRARRNIGVLGAQTGLTLAPLLAHAVTGEIGRGALFCALPLAAEVAMGALMASKPDVIEHGPPAIQYMFFGFLTASLFGSGLGVFDAAKAADRAPSRVGALLQGLRVSAMFDRDLKGAVIGGALAIRPLFATIVLSVVAGCAAVPQNRRERLADPMMSLTDDPLESYRKQKLYNTREGAAGGDGSAAGGGCGCH